MLVRVKQLVRKHINWLVASILGTDTLTEEETQSIEGSPLGIPSLDLIRNAFLLGKLYAKTPRKKHKKLTTDKLRDFASEYKLTPLDELALDYSKARTATYINAAAGDITSAVLAKMTKAFGSALSEADKVAVASEVTAALADNKEIKQFAASLASKLTKDYRDKLVVIASTEVHSARITGLVQSIIQKQDVYKYGDGLESFVSIVPRPETCPDCAKHYLDDKGNPKIMRLSKLMSMGSNGDGDVSHSKKNNIHTHWKTTLPALHPNCRCEVVFIPHGFSWVSGELRLTHPQVFHKSLLKKAADSKLSTVVTPKGPPQAPKPPQPGNIPGVAAPSMPKAGGGGKNYYYAKPGEDTSGPNWEAYKKRDGTMGMRKEVGSGGGAPGATDLSEFMVQAVAEAISYNKTPHPKSEVAHKLANDPIIGYQSLDSDAGEGSSELRIAIIEGGGRALMKKERPANKVINAMTAAAPYGHSAVNESTVSSFANSMGIGKAPIAVMRQHDNETHIMSQWDEESSPVQAKARALGVSEYAHLASLANTPEKKQALKKSLNSTAALSAAVNLSDQHGNNILVNPDTLELNSIDNEAALGMGLIGSQHAVFNMAITSHIKVELNPEDQAKFQKATFGSVRETMPHARSWQVTQTVMRMKYMDFLQKEEGELDPKRFLSTRYNNVDATREVIADDPKYWNRAYGGKDDGDEGPNEFAKREADHTLPNDQLNSFMAWWFTKHSSDLKDPSSEASTLLAGGAFISPSMASKESAGTSFNPVELAGQVASIKKYYTGKPKVNPPTNSSARLEPDPFNEPPEKPASTVASKRKIKKGLQPQARSIMDTENRTHIYRLYNNTPSAPKVPQLAWWNPRTNKTESNSPRFLELLKDGYMYIEGIKFDSGPEYLDALPMAFKSGYLVARRIG